MFIYLLPCIILLVVSYIVETSRMSWDKNELHLEEVESWAQVKVSCNWRTKAAYNKLTCPLPDRKQPLKRESVPTKNIFLCHHPFVPYVRTLSPLGRVQSSPVSPADHIPPPRHRRPIRKLIPGEQVFFFIAHFQVYNHFRLL